MKSDIYDFWVDMREEMWDKDQERAEKKYNDFLEDTKKIAEQCHNVCQELKACKMQAFSFPDQG